MATKTKTKLSAVVSPLGFMKRKQSSRKKAESPTRMVIGGSETFQFDMGAMDAGRQRMAASRVDDFGNKDEALPGIQTDHLSPSVV